MCSVAEVMTLGVQSQILKEVICPQFQVVLPIPFLSKVCMLYQSLALSVEPFVAAVTTFNHLLEPAQSDGISLFLNEFYQFTSNCMSSVQMLYLLMFKQHPQQLKIHNDLVITQAQLSLPASSKLSSPPITQATHLTDSAEHFHSVCVCNPKLCLHLHSVWVFIYVC